MKSYEVIGYAHENGYVLCEECGRDMDGTGDDIPVHPIFAAELDAFFGFSCDCCGRVLTDDGSWEELASLKYR